jgi:hypothetical protein
MPAAIDQSPLGLTWVAEEAMARASHALVDNGRVWLIDPTDEPEALKRVSSLGQPAAVLQLLDRHGRDCSQVAHRLGVEHKRLPQTLPGTPFEVLTVKKTRLWKEIALWWPATESLIVAEALGTNALYAPAGAGAGVHLAMRLSPPQRLAAYKPQHLLVGHGAPIHGPEASLALSEALASSRRDLPQAVFRIPAALFTRAVGR